ncbi:MAG: ribosomal protein S18-alanine N-acetyltransferase [Desulfovibrio sp.]|jgi:ribosomal-protein-alanine N-acetyltransferase
MQTWNCARLGVGDLTEVMDLERLCFRTHWTREQFLLGLERGAFHILGIRDDGMLLAYLAFSLIAGEMEVMNIATHPAHRRKGFAARLLGKALELARLKMAQQAFLEVRRSNLGAIDLYQKFGFIQVGARKHYYPDNNEDALLFRLDFPAPECGASEEH